MKITHTGAGGRASAQRRAGTERGSGRAFAPAIAGEAQRSAGTAPAGRLAALGAVLAVQEVGDAGTGRRRALARGHDLLDRLGELQLALIEGRVPEATLRRVATLVETARPQLGEDERELAATLDEIEVRAAVELAKRRPA